MMNQERSGKFELRVSEDDAEVAYVRLPTYPVGQVKVTKTLRLFDLIGKYDGPDINIDFDEHGVLVGIEVLG